MLVELANLSDDDLGREVARLPGLALDHEEVRVVSVIDAGADRARAATVRLPLLAQQDHAVRVAIEGDAHVRTHLAHTRGRALGVQ